MGMDRAAHGDPPIYLGLGTNLGDRLENLNRALHLLTDHDDVGILAVASVYETSPVGGPPGQSDYFNTAVKIASTMDAPSLLAHILDVERSMGRIRSVVNGPRNIDVDLLIMGNDIFDTPTLSLPHPRLHQRRFVLAPLAEIAPNLRHPMEGSTMQELLDQLPQDGNVVRRIASPNWYAV